LEIIKESLKIMGEGWLERGKRMSIGRLFDVRKRIKRNFIHKLEKD
jgi:hypothetical protein